MKEAFDCYNIADNKKALDCLRELVRTSNISCRPRLVLFTQGNCVPCSQEKALRQPDIDEGIIQEISISSPEGLAIAAKNEIDFVPALVLLDCHDNIILPPDESV